MNNNMVTTQKVETMSSIDFLDGIINPARLAASEKETRYTDFIKRVIDELDLSQNEISVLDNKGKGRNQHYANLDYDQMMLVGMRESKNVRKSVLLKLKELSKPQRPSWLISLSPEAQIAIADLDRQRLEAIATKAEIGSRREATAMATASVLSRKVKTLESKLQDVGTYQSLIASGLPQRISIELNDNAQTWRVLMKISKEMNLPPKKVKDERYGEVNTYHMSVINKFKLDYLD